MGQSKGGGYSKMPTLTPEQTSFLQQMSQMAGGNLGQAAAGYSQFLPGGGGGEAFKQAAQQNFQQQTIPSIMNAFGQGTKGSSSLNQALAGGASNLNTNLGAMLAQMQLQAAQGMGQLGMGQAGLGMTPQFAYLQNQSPIWQQLLQSGIAGGSGILGGWAQSGFAH